MSVMGFQKKKLDGGWVGGLGSIHVYFGFFEFFLTLQSPLRTSTPVADASSSLTTDASNAHVFDTKRAG